MSIGKEGLDKLRATPVVIEVDGLTAMILLGNIQLALRHKSNTGPSAEIVKEFGELLQNKLRGIDAVADLTMEMGWDPEYDC